MESLTSQHATRQAGQIFSDSDLVMKVIEEFDGSFTVNDKASPEVIAREFKLSKNAFKRAVGHLLKERKDRDHGEEHPKNR